MRRIGYGKEEKEEDNVRGKVYASLKFEGLIYVVE